MHQPHLFITPSVPIWRIGSDLIFDRKFYDGMLLYLKKWPGKVTCIISESTGNLPAFGTIKNKVDSVPFACILLKNQQIINEKHLQGASIVLASGDADNQLHLSKLCKKLKVKCIYIIEYIPETRYQIAALSTNKLAVKMRRFYHIWSNERKRLAAFALCDGIQSNGTPAHITYNFVKNNLLYFDTRVYSNQIIDDDLLQTRLNRLLENKPLRLAFSGRLIKIKGADHLVDLAIMLKRANLPFHLTIYGSGDLDEEIKISITRNHLENEITLPGSVDFYNKLLPELKQNVDIFICLHRQSDPSCTYLETFSCGVPIIGYKNKAFDGLLKISEIGWGANIDDVTFVYHLISHLNVNRAELFEKSKNSVTFSRHHDFENTFQNRINQLLNTADMAWP